MLPMTAVSLLPKRLVLGISKRNEQLPTKIVNFAKYLQKICYQEPREGTAGKGSPSELLVFIK